MVERPKWGDFFRRISADSCIHHRSSRSNAVYPHEKACFGIHVPVPGTAGTWTKACSPRKAKLSSGRSVTRPHQDRRHLDHRREGCQLSAAPWSSRARPTCTTPASGNYCRVEGTKVKSRQVGRLAHRDLRGNRGTARFAGLHAAAARGPLGRCASHAGTHSRAAYARRLPAARPDQPDRLRQPLQPDRANIEATTLTEPYISLAEKKGCRADLFGLDNRKRFRSRRR